MTTTLFISMIGYIFATAVSPGPNVILVFNASVQHGIKGSRMLRFGIWSGFITLIILGSIITYTASTFVPSLIEPLKYIGIAYILYLSYKIMRSTYNMKSAVGQTFKEGYLLQFVNVKVILFVLTLYAGYIAPYYTELYQFLLFGFLIMGNVVIATWLWIIAGQMLKKWIEQYQFYFNLFMVAILLQTAYHLAL